jgi:hypothetical protein
MPSTVECLSCGQTREPVPDLMHRVHMDDCCPRCGYVGWAPSGELNESTRRALRERPLRRRRLVSVT